ETVFNIVDYKSGGDKKYSPKAVLEGNVLQLPLYAVAVEDHLLSGQNAVPWQAGNWFLREKGFKSMVTMNQSSDDQVLQPVPSWKELRENILDQVFAMVAAVRDGNFPVFSRDDHCSGYCEFSTTCRINHVRSLEKTWTPQTP
ncbi:MAG: PD-(D/E)XK nuclease family protein, partial [Planctomycetales bacterium]